MALKSGSLGTLLQGVSQQPARVRTAGQVSEQINLISDVTRGLSTRPATEMGSYLLNATDHNFTEITLDGEDYILGYKDQDLRVWDLDGTEYPVTYDAGTADYIGYNMRFHVVDKQIVCLNRDKVVAIDENSIDGIPSAVGIVHALGGQFAKTYTMNVVFSDGTDIEVSYETPDGTTDGDAAETASDYIIRELRSAFLSANPPAGTNVGRKFDTFLIRNSSLTFEITVSDGEGGEILRSVTDTATDVTDLPKYAPNGHVVKVVSSEADEDDFWLKFVIDGVTVEDGATGFGSEGVWQEWYDPEQARLYDYTTMPHKLVKTNTGFEFSQVEWEGRLVGDEDSSPFASIVDKKIRDINGFESRLVLLSSSTVVMSRTEKPFNLWRESATLVNATDPVDITSTKKDDLVLDWVVPFDRDLFIIADPGDSQFVIRGGGVDSTTSMVLTTEFDVSSAGTAPVSTGRTILLPFQGGDYSGIKEFYTSSENSSQAANSLTETQDRYISGVISGMAVSQNFNMGLFRTDTSGSTLWVYKYLWDGNQSLQSAWGKWEFADEVRHFFFRKGTVYFISKELSGAVFIHSLDLNRRSGRFGYHEMLDRRQEVTVSNSTLNLSYADARFLQSTGCANEGLEASAETVSRVGAYEWQYTFSEDVVPDGAELILGQTVEWLLEPSEVFAVDYQQRIDTSQKVTIQDYSVSVYESGEFKALGSSPYSPDWEYSAFTFPFDGEPLDPDRTLVRTGTFTIPWGERADWSTLQLTGTDIRPVTIHEIEWIGQKLSTKGRRA